MLAAVGCRLQHGSHPAVQHCHWLMLRDEWFGVVRSCGVIAQWLERWCAIPENWVRSPVAPPEFFRLYVPVSVLSFFQLVCWYGSTDSYYSYYCCYYYYSRHFIETIRQNMINEAHKTCKHTQKRIEQQIHTITELWCSYTKHNVQIVECLD